MPRILILDTYYPDFLKSFYINPALTYQSQLEGLLYQSFGTFDAVSRHLKALGWDTGEVIGNSDGLQSRWAYEHGVSGLDSEAIVLEQIKAFEPDIVFLQDLNFFSIETMQSLGGGYILAGQLSCPWPGDDRVYTMRCLFSSFPHYIPRIEKLGVKAVFNPLAFDPIVIERAVDGMVSGRFSRQLRERPYDCVFVGGVGAPSHWKAGMEVLEEVAREVPTFKWWGYGAELLPAGSALRDKYMGQAWGLDYYRILAQAKVCINRHGEVAQGYSNNMRCFEATGMGALLVTENSLNLSDYFNATECVSYGSPEEAVYAIKSALNNEPVRKQIAANGQTRTLRDHTYAKRMEKVSEVLKGMLCAAYP